MKKENGDEIPKIVIEYDPEKNETRSIFVDERINLGQAMQLFFFLAVQGAARIMSAAQVQEMQKQAKRIQLPDLPPNLFGPRA